MTTTSDPAAPDGVSARPARPSSGRRRAGRWGAGLLVMASGAAGWVLAGSPGDASAIHPPPCPAFVDPDDASARAGRSPGVADQLVPMPLPQPRGPVSVRVCGYGQGSETYQLRRSAVVEPVRTSALAGLLNESPGPVLPALPVLSVLPDGGHTPGCPPAATVAVLIFRYTEGPPVEVQVIGGACALVRTPARAETGRQDVVRRVDELLASAR